MKMRTHKISLVFILAALCISSAATATTLMHMSVAKMAQTAMLIVRARCVGSSSAWDKGEIWTFTSFEIEDSWKSSAAANAGTQITVRLLGGSVGNLTSLVSGVPRFHPGEEVILFLEPKSGGEFSIVSWIQGTFRIHRDQRSGEELATQDTASFDTYDPVTRQFNAVGIRNMSVATLRLNVQSALAAQTGAKE
jgi:hypothetical protein